VRGDVLRDDAIGLINFISIVPGPPQTMHVVVPSEDLVRLGNVGGRPHFLPGFSTMRVVTSALAAPLPPVAAAPPPNSAASSPFATAAASAAATSSSTAAMLRFMYNGSAASEHGPQRVFTGDVCIDDVEGQGKIVSISWLKCPSFPRSLLLPTVGLLP
jgi:hypothetical protein